MAIVAKIRYRQQSKLFPDRVAGWYWWFSCPAPDGQDLVGRSKGPFDTSMAAVHDVKDKYGLEAKLDQMQTDLG